MLLIIHSQTQGLVVSPLAALMARRVSASAGSAVPLMSQGAGGVATCGGERPEFN